MPVMEAPSSLTRGFIQASTGGQVVVDPGVTNFADHAPRRDAHPGLRCHHRLERGSIHGGRRERSRDQPRQRPVAHAPIEPPNPGTAGC